jgi:general L-amino acid transport system substrate-binding protein
MSLNKAGNRRLMKRTLFLFVALSALVLVLVGCGDTSALESENASLRSQVSTLEDRVANMEEEMAGMAMMEGGRLDAVRERGHVICASRDDVPGYGGLDAAGNNVGFDIDLCRALAAAVVGDPNAIEIRLITAAERGPTIQSGEVDMLVRTVT